MRCLTLVNRVDLEKFEELRSRPSLKNHNGFDFMFETSNRNSVKRTL